MDRPAVQSQVVDRVLSSFKPEEKHTLEEKTGEVFGYIEDFLSQKR